MQRSRRQEQIYTAFFVDSTLLGTCQVGITTPDAQSLLQKCRRMIGWMGEWVDRWND